MNVIGYLIDSIELRKSLGLDSGVEERVLRNLTITREDVQVDEFDPITLPAPTLEDLDW